MCNFITKLLIFTLTVTKLPFREVFSIKKLCEKNGFEQGSYFIELERKDWVCRDGLNLCDSQNSVKIKL